MCDVEQCKNTPAKELLNGDYNECANMDVLPGESSTELEEYQICQIMERVNRHFDMIHIVPSTDRIHDKLLCKTKLMNMRINDTCHESFALPPSFIHLEDKSIRDGWKPIICAASIEVNQQLSQYFILFPVRSQFQLMIHSPSTVANLKKSADGMNLMPVTSVNTATRTPMKSSTMPVKILVG